MVNIRRHYQSLHLHEVDLYQRPFTAQCKYLPTLELFNLCKTLQKL